MDNYTWESSTDFKYKFLSGAWKLAEKNLDSLFIDYSDITVCRINEDDLLEIDCVGVDEDVTGDEWYNDFKGPAWYIGFWAFFALVFTILGIVWCLCNKCVCCCSRSKSELFDLENTDPEFDTSGSSSNTKNRKIWIYVLGVLMCLFTFGYLYSTVMAVASNEAIRSAIYDLPDEVRKPLNDAEQYLSITKGQITFTFIDSYDELAREIRQVAGLKDGSPTPQINLLSLANSNDKLIAELIRSNNEVNDELAKKVNPIVSKLRSLEQFVSSLNSSNVDEKQSNPELEQAIRQTGEGLSQNANSLIDALGELETPISDVRRDVDKAEDDWLNAVGNSVYGTFMTTNVIIILMLIGIVVGSAFIWFVKGEAKKTGFILHRFAITTMFVVGWVIVIMMVCGFALAGVFSQVFCEGVRELENGSGNTASNRLHYVKSVVPLQNTGDNGYVLPSYSYVVQNFKAGKSAYQSLDLNQVYDVSEVLTISDNFRGIINNPKLQRSSNITEAFVSHKSALEEVGVSLNEMSALPNSGWIRKLYNKVVSDFEPLAKNLDEAEATITSTKRQAEVEIIRLVDEYANSVYLDVTENIGETRPLYNALHYGIDIVCYRTVAPVATYWWAFQFLLIMFVGFMITAMVTERCFKA